jgi:hypothetical protein
VLRRRGRRGLVALLHLRLGALTTLAALDYEAQPAGFGLEVQVTDAPRAGSSGSDAFNQPASLSEFATVLVAVGDVNEAPAWPALTTCAAPSSSNVYVSAPSTLSTIVGRLRGLLLRAGELDAVTYVPVNSTAGSPAQAVAKASDPDVFWSSSHRTATSGSTGTTAQSLVYSLAASNNVVGSAAIFGVDGALGALSVLLGGAATLNFESAARTYALTAVVTDASTSVAFSPLSASAAVALYVTDVNKGADSSRSRPARCRSRRSSTTRRRARPCAATTARPVARSWPATRTRRCPSGPT